MRFDFIAIKKQKPYENYAQCTPMFSGYGLYLFIILA